MVDASEAAESKYLTADQVEDSPTRIGFIVSAGAYEESQYGRQLKVKINFDKKEKTWNVNRISAKNLIDAWGKDTDQWVGNKVAYTVKEENNKTMVIGTPLDPKKIEPTPAPAVTTETVPEQHEPQEPVPVTQTAA